MKFTKKQVTIDAWILTESVHCVDAIIDIVGSNASRGPDGSLKIKTLEGTMTAVTGDYIIKGVQGEFYPCKPDIFDATYTEASVDCLTFGQALEAAKAGRKIARKGWNGSGMFAYIVPANSYPAQTEVIKGVFENDMVPYREYWALKTVQNDVATWSPSGSDTLANDWEIV